ncbi:hypothetical protein [Streptomyces sp. CA-111067]|uniref:hypothetical protein n=1 Tax=Streptomyces sp. CA-111067 TaxID=3240046 RepID=UPI003D97671B
MTMELVYCVHGGRRAAAEFGRAAWGDEAVVPEQTAGVSALAHMTRLRAGELSVTAFSGTITEVITDPNGMSWVTVARTDGEEDEIPAFGGVELYRAGRRLTVREINTAAPSDRLPSYLVIEVWLDRPPSE